MESFFIKVLIGAFASPQVRESLVLILQDERARKSIKDLIGGLITERILPLVPLAIGGAVKSAVDEVIQHIPGVSAVVDAGHATEGARNVLNNLIPDVDLGIPALDNLLDWWRPHA